MQRIEEGDAELQDQGLGLNYTKALYRQFTDGTFSIEAPTALYQGILGPTLRVEVGDTLVVVFKVDRNMLPVRCECVTLIT